MSIFDEVLEITKEISRAYYPERGGPKGAAILNWIIRNLPFGVEYIPEIGIIVASEEILPVKEEISVDLMVVSHFDLIRSFNKAFEQVGWEAFKIGEKNIKGPLDNTITNAALLWSLKNGSVFRESKNWIVLFSQEEEEGFIGMRKFLERFGVAAKFFVNLDVTNEGWGKFHSIEYDKPHLEPFFAMAANKEIAASSPGIHFTENREGDDLDAVLWHGGIGFSYCLPTKGTIHSIKNKASKRSVEEYTKLLPHICESMLACVSKHSGEFTNLPWKFRGFSGGEHMRDLWNSILEGKSMEEIKEDFAKEEESRSFSGYSAGWGGFWNAETEEDEDLDLAGWFVSFALLNSLHILEDSEFYERIFQKQESDPVRVEQQKVAMKKLRKFLKSNDYYSSREKIFEDTADFVGDVLADLHDYLFPETEEAISGFMEAGILDRKTLEDIVEKEIDILVSFGVLPDSRYVRQEAQSALFNEVCEMMEDISGEDLRGKIEQAGLHVQELAAAAREFGLM